MHQQFHYLYTLTNNVTTLVGVLGLIVYIQMLGLIGNLNKN